MTDSRLLAAVLLLFVGCTTVEHEAVAPVGVTVSELTEGRLFGGRAIYEVKAPVSVVREILLDFASHTEFRPTVREAVVVESGPEGGTVILRFAGYAGIHPRVTCTYTVAEDDGRVSIRYEMIDGGMSLWALKGGFDLRPYTKGGRDSTLVTQDFLISALVLNRQALLNTLREDAVAIQDRVEEVSGSQ